MTHSHFQIFYLMPALFCLLIAPPLHCQQSAAPKYTYPTSPKPPDETLLHTLQQKWNNEPSLNMLIASALRYAEAGGGRSDRWAVAVRRSPVLPTLKISVGYDLERDESLDRTQDDPDRWGADADNDFGIQATAQWELADLIYHPDELKVYQTLSHRAERREEIIALIIGYYFERQRLQLTLTLRPPATIEETVEQTFRLKELTALIDALTGGTLSRNL
ncbi:MAG: hypothetical protein JXX29_17555 [Deltaproteobacteria bacterium]|nr:hypothetical protein [Deltaproteobacteria bacterium]MBN2673491.1 hypothetical protein [Deltaproteobacteria bacterium]